MFKNKFLTIPHAIVRATIVSTARLERQRPVAYTAAYTPIATSQGLQAKARPTRRCSR